MVWGIEMPGNFGDFFPNGEYVGWKERLTAYFNNEMLTEQKAIYSSDPRPICYINDASQKFTREVGAKARGVPLGPLQDHEKPTTFKLIESQKALASFIQLNVRLLAVDEALKNIIERLEPGVHQFWPIQIMIPKDDEYPTRYFGIVIRRFLDSFLPEKSDEGSYDFQGAGYYPKYPQKQYYNGLAMSQTVIGSAHLWRDNNLRSPQILISDELLAEITKAVTDLLPGRPSFISKRPV